MSEPLLLHSLAEFEHLLDACFDTVAARTFVEIGSESGAFTQALVARGGSVTTVEPFPVPAVVDLARERPDALRLVQGRSPAALAEVGAADVWIIDGDHNFWTVRQEVEHALDQGAQAGRPPLLVLHDVGWPWARRDLYYDPAGLPPEAVHPHSFTEGVAPGEPGLVPSGFRGEGHFAAAREEGGPRNGVRTAVEDVLRRRGGLTLAVVPLIYGVGLLWPTDAPFAEALAALVAPFDRSPLLERVERNRVNLYLRVLELQDALGHADGRSRRVLAGYDQRIAELEAENAALRVALARQRAATG